MSQKVRVRFAPSPTGPLHIGGVRTALFNYLFAKRHGGDFLLRIEDTDQARYVEGAEAYIIESLNWLNIPFDEGPGKEGSVGPYKQSERKEIYQQYAEELIASGHAYYAFDTSEELATLRQKAEQRGEAFIYNWHNRETLNNSLNRSSKEVNDLLEQGVEYVVRFKMLDLNREKEDESIIAKDIIRGDVSFKLSLLDDKVLFKSDGMPTYHLANIVDDYLMKISHVIRGEEWLPSVPLHLKLYKAFNWVAPAFAHLPLIMKPEGKGKLSKRDGDKMGFPVFPLAWNSPEGEVYSGYREDGYLAEAVVNMLALLGWNPGTEQEIFNLEELTRVFDLERVHKSGAKFDPEKTKWFQHYYFQQLEEALITEAFSEYLLKKGIPSHKNISQIVSLLKDRATFVEDFWIQGNFFFETPPSYDEKAALKAFKPESAQHLQKVLNLVTEAEPFSANHISETIKNWIEAEGIGFGKVMMPLRLALVGEMKGPDVFEIAAILGRGETIKRLKSAIAEIG